MASIVFNTLRKQMIEAINHMIYGGVQDVRDTRDPEKIGQYIINRPKNMTANERADNLNSQHPDNYKYEPTKPDYSRNGN